MSVETSVKISGLRELARAFKQIDADLPKELRDEFRKVGEHVAGVARTKTPTLTGRAAGSIKVRASTRGVSLAVGGTRAPYFQWLDYGGRVGRKRSIVRPFVKGGRIVYPAIAESNDEIRKGADAAIEKVAKRAGFTTKGNL